MSISPMWCFECLDVDEAVELLGRAPEGSHVEVVPKTSGDLILLWVPVSPELIEHEIGRAER